MQKSFRAKQEDAVRNWYHFDASDQVLGKLAVRIARILMGKDEPTFTPGVDTGHFVVVTNAAQVKATGAKEEKKLYRWHTGYPGGLKEVPLHKMLEKDAAFAVRHAVKGMLPKNKLGRAIYRNMKVYVGPDHDQEAQKPEVLDLSSIR